MRPYDRNADGYLRSRTLVDAADVEAEVEEPRGGLVEEDGLRAVRRVAIALDGPRRYTSLVPTQLIKVLDSPRATAALREVDALLVGGAAGVAVAGEPRVIARVA